MKILLIRTIAIEEDLSVSTYNNQEVGLATELVKRGNECGIVYYAKRGNGYEETIERDGAKIKIYHIEGKNFIWNAIYDKKIYDICEKYDIIQTSECDQIASWLIYKRFPDKTIIYHGPYKSKYTIKYNLRSKVFDLIFSNKANFKNAHVITKSYLAENYLRKKGFKNVITLGVGLNISNLNHLEKDIPKKIDDVIKEKRDYKYIMFIGAISKRKNFKFMLEILNNIVNEKKQKKYKLIVIGSKAYKEEKYYNDCSEYIKEKNLENNVVYLGKVEQKYLSSVYNVSDVYVLPTKYDIFGMVYLEAMYYGVPIVTTLCGGSSLLIKDDNYGLIEELDNQNAWTYAILKICEDLEFSKRISENTKREVNENYLWSVLAEKFECEYKKIK